jgi:hypothetical protein
MARFLCIFPCQYKGDTVRKGAQVDVDDAALHLPANARLLSTRNFIRLDAPVATVPPVALGDPAGIPPGDASAASGDQPPPPPPDGETTRERLFRRASELGCTPRAKATIAELEKLIADAASPDGHPRP